MEYLQIEQGSTEWLEARKGVITGTRLKSVMSTRSDTRKGLIYELIAEMIAPMPEGYKSPAMERGNIIEEIVKELYPEVEEVGLVKKYEWLGVSPDGLFENRTRAIEIKSPEPKAFIRYWLEGGIPDEYYWQVVQYFVIMDDLKSLDFVIYNPEIRDKKYRLKSWTIPREELHQDILKAKESLSKFRSEWMESLSLLVYK